MKEDKRKWGKDLVLPLFEKLGPLVEQKVSQPPWDRTWSEGS